MRAAQPVGGAAGSVVPADEVSELPPDSLLLAGADDVDDRLVGDELTSGELAAWDDEAAVAGALAEAAALAVTERFTVVTADVLVAVHDASISSDRPIATRRMTQRAPFRMIIVKWARPVFRTRRPDRPSN